jgi:hypothetical protein
MKLEDNPLLKPEDYMAGYKDSIENLKNRPELISWDKMCYELFKMNKMGVKFLEYVEEKYLIPSLTNPDAANYSVKVIFTDGYKEAYRAIKRAIRSHEQRIQAEGR